MASALKALLFLALFVAFSQSRYLIGAQGQSCWDVCFAKGLNCNPLIQTNNSTEIFVNLGINCQQNNKAWWAEDQPSYSSSPFDPNFGRCLGYINVPASVNCAGSYPTTRRLCNCDDANTASSKAAFGTAYSGGFVNSDERTMFAHVLPSGGSFGVMTHFWSTAPFPGLEHTMVRYYIDGESVSSIAFFPPLACGSGFNDQHNPWGTKWFGKGAKNGAWFNNFRIPFEKSIKVTVQSYNGTFDGFYLILRGLLNFPINIGDIAVPYNAKLKLQVFNQSVQPLEWIPIADVPKGSGLFFMHSLAVSSGNLNFLEGCYHQYSPYNQAFPGTLLSSGTEDYFDSAWYFDGGEFWLPVSGFTHYNQNQKGVTWSAYRFHEMDPLPFTDGFKLVWRNGDVVDAAGLKCYAQTGQVVGHPTVSEITVYAWVYVW